MCGLAGVIVNNGFSEGQLTEIGTLMGQRLRQRGPDDAGIWCSVENGVMFSHRRLSIVDVSVAGHQPMLSEHRRYVIAFNGEIYNHLTLRTELSKEHLAPNWRGHSDTETLLAAFEAWGVQETLKKTVGMFAIALWDIEQRVLYLARDRLGEKPLFYGWVRGSFVFGSELKALTAYPGFDNPINRDALALYTEFSAVPSPYSIYQDIAKLNPGSILSISTSDIVKRSVHIDEYWSITEVVNGRRGNIFVQEEQAISALDEVLKIAVAEQSRADVPTGAFLSGGVDSTLIVALMQAQSQRQIKSFSVGFDESQFDESPFADAVAKHIGTDHHSIRVTAADAQSVIPLLPTMYDEPFADSSQIPTHLVSKFARKLVTVALSGDGGDELFGGYNRYVRGHTIWNRMRWLPTPLRVAVGTGLHSVPLAVWDLIGQGLYGATGAYKVGGKVQRVAHRLRNVQNLSELHYDLVREWFPSDRVVLGASRLPTRLDDLGFMYGTMPIEERMMLWDTLTYLPDDLLTKVDRASMSTSLEARVPYLDHRVVELSWRLPLQMKIRKGESKWALRQLLYKYVPRELIDRPKAGFTVPIGQWLRGPLRDWAEALISESRLRREGYFNVVAVRRAWQEHLSGSHDRAGRLWIILMYQAWLEVSHS